MKHLGVTTTTPYHDLVPMDPIENVRWRLTMREEARKDVRLQAVLRQAAFKDVLFFFKAFCWVFEPRPTPRILPFIPWVHQEPAILTLDENCGIRDVGVDKSRGEGATWMYLMVIFRRWLRDPLFSAGLVSRNMDAVDKKDDPDCLLWKLDWELKMLPYWLKPNSSRSLVAHSLTNDDTGATIVGYAATGDVGSGGRKTVFAMDELAKFNPGQDEDAMNSTQHVTDCRFIVSTYKGDSGAYYDCMNAETNIVKIILDWKDNPTRNRHLYRYEKGRCVASDPKDQQAVDKYAKEHRPDLDKLRRRGFIREGAERSPWYDLQCLRPGATVRGIAQELDRNPRGTVSKIFDGEVLDRMLRDSCRQPTTEGRLLFYPENCQPCGYVAAEGGELKLWVPVGIHKEIQPGMFVVGADIAAGTGGSHSSNSSACVTDRITGEQVAEFASFKILPGRFARLCIALCRWFHNAYLAWEANGPTGAAFTKEVMEVGYSSIFYREVEIEGSHKKTQKPGFWMANDEVRLKVFDQLGMAMDDLEFIPRSEDMVKECRQYQWKNGHIVHVGSERSDDEADKGKSHGDRAVAAAMAWIGIKDQPRMRSESEDEIIMKPPVGSMAYRIMEHEMAMNAQRDPWGGELPVALLEAGDPWN